MMNPFPNTEYLFILRQIHVISIQMRGLRRICHFSLLSYCTELNLKILPLYLEFFMEYISLRIFNPCIEQHLNSNITNRHTTRNMAAIIARHLNFVVIQVGGKLVAHFLSLFLFIAHLFHNALDAVSLKRPLRMCRSLDRCTSDDAPA